jgi:S1-C subfamily serine protease
LQAQCISTEENFAIKRPGIVRSVKSSVGNRSLIQVDVSTSPVNSGGPVCNERGEVIGILLFGSIENSTGELASGFNFAIPVYIVMEFIDGSKIHSMQREFSMVFNDGVQMLYKNIITVY